MRPGLLWRLRYSPFLAQVVITRRCNLACGYCTEYDHASAPVPTAVLQERFARLRDLGTFIISLTGGEPTLHPELPRLIRYCRELGFLRTGMISNGFLLRPALIDALNEAGLQELQLSIDGVRANETTQKVLDNLETRLTWLEQRARFHVTVSGVVGACPPDELRAIISRVRARGFTPRTLLVHDDHGGLQLEAEEQAAYRQVHTRIPWTWTDISDYRGRLLRDGTAPFKCRAGSRYLYVDENGLVSWCSQTRDRWSKPLQDYGAADLREQFTTHKPCQDTCTLGCSRSASQFDGWRVQHPPAP